MSHITYNDIIERIDYKVLANLTNQDPTIKTVNEVKVGSIISSVNDILDGYLRGRYSLPLHNPSSVVKEAGIAIATFLLYSLRPNVSTAIETAYTTALSTMNKIQKGEIILDEGGINKTPAASFFKSCSKPSRMHILERLL